jgi:hypothetical protein
MHLKPKVLACPSFQVPRNGFSETAILGKPQDNGVPEQKDSERCPCVYRPASALV